MRAEATMRAPADGSSRLATTDRARMAADEGAEPDASAVVERRPFDALRYRLVLFVIIALTPIVIGNVAQGLLAIERERDAARDRLVSAALGATGAEESILIGADQVLSTLAALPAVRDGTDACGATLASVRVALPYSADIMRIDPQGQVDCAAGGTAEGTSVAASPWWRSLADGAVPIIGLGGAARDVVIVAQPVRRADGASDGAVVMTVAADRLGSAFGGRMLPDEALVALIAPDGSVIAGDERMASVVAGPAQSVVGEPMLRETTASDGIEWSSVTTPILGGRAYVAIAVPSDSLFRWSYLNLAVSLLLPVLMIALALVTIWIASERLILRWLRYLQRVAAAYAAGHYALRLNRIGAAPAEFRELGRSVTAMAEAVRERDRRLRETVAHRTALVREIHHRIKNSLQIVTSLVSLQAAQIKDPTARAGFDILRSRVDALALAHRLIREAEDGSRIELQELIAELTAQHANGLGRSAQRIETRTVSCLLPTDRAVPLTLLLNELLSALRRGPDGERRQIRLTAERNEPGVLALTVASDQEAPLHHAGMPGAALVDGFVSQLHGRIVEIRDAAGRPAVRVTFTDTCL